MALLRKSQDLWLLLVIFIFVLQIPVAYMVENRRGKNAWQKYKHELEAKGVILDFNKLTPPPVPDELNIFKAPKMAGWFVKSKNMTNELVARLDFKNFSRQFPNRDSLTLARVTVVPPDGSETISSNQADLDLRCIPSAAAFFLGPKLFQTNQSLPGYTIPLIQFEDVPLDVGIENLARQAGVNFYYKTNSYGQVISFPLVSLRWQNLTALQTLQALLNQSGLQLMSSPQSNSLGIVKKNAGTSPVYTSPDLRKTAQALLQAKLGATLVGSQGTILLTTPPGQLRPLQITCRSESPLVVKDAIQFFKDLFPDNSALGKDPRIYVEHDGTNAFRVTMDAVSAADYLKWSDEFSPDFDLVRNALKRPYARMDGDYSNLVNVPLPNFMSIRAVTQTLAQRTQCYLLLNQPEKALPDITLLSQLHRLLEGAPTGKPMTLVAAMINVAVTGVYADAVADGIRMHAWHSPELASLQAQLKHIDMFPVMSGSIQSERTAWCSYLDNLLAGKLSLAQQVKEESRFGTPRGWVYQNLVTIARLDQMAIDSIDPSHQLVLPDKMDDFQQQLDHLGKHFHPYSYIAMIVVLNYGKAAQTFAYDQTLANETQVACALEQYRLTHGDYPEKLDALVPQFAGQLPRDIIGGQALHYGRTDDGKFLLYSVGWNETDDDGSPGKLKDVKNGDWVWED